jgi:hypothetical protein
MGVLAGAVATSATLVTTQERFDPGTFEFGHSRTFDGRLEADPYPVLAVAPPAAPDQNPARFRFVLVGFGKTGAAEDVGSHLGSDAMLDGTLVYRDDMTMVEIAPGTVKGTTLGARSVEADVEVLGELTLAGEIVDLKCYLGVMKPGRGKPHRACAANCIRGGIPPVLVVDDEEAPARHFMLVDGSERPVNERVLDVVAEPIEITGEVVRKDNLYYLKADPGTYRRLTG